MTTEYKIKVNTTSGATPDGHAFNTAEAKLSNGGEPVSNEAILFAVSGHTAKLESGNISGIVLTDSNGSAIVQVSDTVAEPVIITAIATSFGVSDSGEMFFGEEDQFYQLGIECGSGADADSKSQNPITITLTDIRGNPIDDKKIELNVSGNALFSNGKNRHSILTQDGGLATDYITDSVGETVTVTAMVGEVSSSDNSKFNTKDKGHNLSLSSTSGAPADGITANILSVKLTDLSGGAIVDAKIDLSLSGSCVFDDGKSTRFLKTNANGTASAKIFDTKAEVVTITAVYENEEKNTSCEFTQICKYQFILDVESGAKADGSMRNIVNATLTDDSQKPISGVYIALTVTGNSKFSNGNNFVNLKTDSSGKVADFITDSVPENVKVSADFSIGNCSLSDEKSSVFVEADGKYSANIEVPLSVHLSPQESGAIVITGMKDGAIGDSNVFKNVRIELDQMKLKDPTTGEIFNEFFEGLGNTGNTDYINLNLLPVNIGVATIRVNITYSDNSIETTIHDCLILA